MSATGSRHGAESEERSLTARNQTSDWVDHYLSHVPFERLYRSLVKHALGQLQLALGPRYGRLAAAAVLESLLGHVPASDEDSIGRRLREGDSTLVDDDAVDWDWQDIAAEFAHLFAFARYGEGRMIDPEASRADIESLLTHCRRIAADPGMQLAAGTDFEWITDSLAAAEARWAIDHGKPLMPEGLAALAGVKPKTIANQLAARELSTDGSGRIPAAEALRFLERRKDFVRSTWQDPIEEPPAADTSAPRALVEQVFVPVDGDGSPFLPSLARRGRDGVPRYAIGAKTDPEYIEDYWEALEQLARMPMPRWRRPPMSGKGGWSLVSAQDGWRRFARADLERMVEATREQEG